MGVSTEVYQTSVQSFISSKGLSAVDPFPSKIGPAVESLALEGDTPVQCGEPIGDKNFTCSVDLTNSDDVRSDSSDDSLEIIEEIEKDQCRPGRQLPIGSPGVEFVKRRRVS